MNSKINNLVREAKHAGSWYTNSKMQLNAELQTNLQNANPKSPSGLIKAIIGPHAGFTYSGPNAAWAYKNICDQYDRVFVIGPSHKVSFEFIATTNCQQWATPLGDLQVDNKIVNELVQNDQAEFQKIDKSYEENEHSLEMHLPYIRKVFEQRINTDNDVQIIPLMVGQLSSAQYPNYANILLPYFLDQRTLFVISSDFCHWGSRFRFTHKYDEFQDSQIHKSIEQLDNQGMEFIENHDLEGFQAYLAQTKNTICGRNPIQLLLSIIQLASKEKQFKTKFLKYDQSSQVKDLNDSSVSYASAIIQQM